MNKPKLIAVVAVAKNGIIGNKGKIPWHCAEDLKWFKQTTINKPVLMGRKTFESLPKRPLPNRQNIVVSRTMQPDPNVQILRDLNEISTLPYPEIYVIGGGEIYAKLLPNFSELLVTHMKKDYEGDTSFPDFSQSFEKDRVIKENDEFTIVSYLPKK